MEKLVGLVCTVVYVFYSRNYESHLFEKLILVRFVVYLLVLFGDMCKDTQFIDDGAHNDLHENSLCRV